MKIKALDKFISRLAAWGVCLLLAAVWLPVSAQALEGESGGLSWSLSAGTLTVSGNGAMLDYSDAHMPPWYDSAASVHRIVVEEGVTSLGSLAFYGCSAATSVSLPETLTAIGDRAFKECASLTALSLPANLLEIGEAAFESCTGLVTVQLPEGLTSIGHYAFMLCTGLSTITVPSTVTDLGMVVFAYDTRLTRVELLCPLEKLPDWTFYGCSLLSVVVLPSTVTQVGDSAFYDCSGLTTVYYPGESEAVHEALLAESATRLVLLVTDTEAIPPTEVTSTSVYDDSTQTATVTEVSVSDQATITTTKETSYTYTVGGESVSQQEAQEALTSDPERVTITSESSSTVNALITGSEGWQELATTTAAASKTQPAETPLAVNVQLTGSTVAGEDLAQLAGQQVTLSVSTASGSTWVVDETTQSASSFQKNEYNLDFDVTKLTTNNTGIESDSVYRVKFSSDIDFSAQVGIHLKTDEAYQYATLYQKDWLHVTALQTAVIDADGNAWFSLANVDASTQYYVGVNTPDASADNAIVPDSLAADYGGDGTLTDANGVTYQITGRASRWGITGGQFALYVALAIGGVVLLVSLIMITLNKIARSKARYAIPQAEELPPLDEEELRLQVMQELLDEQNKQEP